MDADAAITEIEDIVATLKANRLSDKVAQREAEEWRSWAVRLDNAYIQDIVDEVDELHYQWDVEQRAATWQRILDITAQSRRGRSHRASGQQPD